MDLHQLFSELFKMAVEADNDKVFKDLYRFYKLILLNKGLKSNSNSRLVYEIASYVIPQLIWFQNFLTSRQQLNLDLLGDAIIELI